MIAKIIGALAVAICLIGAYSAAGQIGIAIGGITTVAVGGGVIGSVLSIISIPVIAIGSIILMPIISLILLLIWILL